MTMSVARTPTLRDVAAHAEVSLATASRVLNEDPRVREDLADRVRQSAEELGYVTNIVAKALRGHQRTIAMLVDDIDTEAVGEVVTAMELAALDEGLVATVSAAGGRPERQLAALSALIGVRPRALVLTGSWVMAPGIQRPLEASLRRYVDDGGNVVLLGPPSLFFDSVGFDDRGAGELVGRHMASRGAASAIVLAGGEYHHAFVDRTEGILSALDAYGVSSVRVIHSPVTRAAGVEEITAAIDEGVPDLVIASNDRLASGALAALKMAGLRVPEDVAVSGVDDVAVAADMTPSLTTVRLPFAEAGRRAVQVALHPSSAHRQQLKLKGQLVVRESSAVTGVESAR